MIKEEGHHLGGILRPGKSHIRLKVHICICSETYLICNYLDVQVHVFMCNLLGTNSHCFAINT